MVSTYKANRSADFFECTVDSAPPRDSTLAALHSIAKHYGSICRRHAAHEIDSTLTLKV